MIRVGDFVRPARVRASGGPVGQDGHRYRVVAIHFTPGENTGKTYEVALGGGSIAFLTRETCVKDEG